MTSLIDNTIDELIGRVRQRTAVSDMVFMSAYPPRRIPNPINKYIVVADQTGVERSQVFIGDTVGAGMKGALYEVKLTLRVYAPRNTAASALLRMSSLLYDAVEACDQDRMITDMRLGAIGYDNVERTAYRVIGVRLSLLLTGEGAR